MKCWTVNRRLSAYLDNGVPEAERAHVKYHLHHCTSCAVRLESQQLMRTTLRSLPRMAPPADLTLRLRILASKERQLDWTPRSRAKAWRARVHLALSNMMKPIALPAAGGLCAAMLLFMTLVPSFTTNRNWVEDVPLCDLSPSTEPMLKSFAPIGFNYGDAEVDLRIDQYGRIVNYSIVSAPGNERDALRRSIENNLLFTTFTPATSFGVPKSSTMRLSFRSSRIDVKG